MRCVLVVGLLVLFAAGCAKDDGRESASLFQLSPQQAKALKTPDATYIGKRIQLRTDVGRRPQPLAIPRRGNQNETMVPFETVYFEYTGEITGPKAIAMFADAGVGEVVHTGRELSGHLFVAVPPPEATWSRLSELQYDGRFGNAAGYILRYSLNGAPRSTGMLIVASDATDTRYAVEIGSVPARWAARIGVDGSVAQDWLHFVLAPPAAHGFNESGCGSIGICEDYCSAAIPYDIQDCGSPCCNSDSGAQPFTHQCNDTLDNDTDGGTDASDTDCQHNPSCEDGPQHAHRFESGFSFMLTAKTTWCSETTDPFGKLWARSGYNKQAFRSGTGNAAWDTFKLTNDNVARPVAVKCWIFADPDDASDCDLNGDCGAFGSGSSNPYPFAQVSESADLYDAAMGDLHHSATVGLDDPVSLLQVIVKTFEASNPGPGSDAAAGGAALQPGRVSIVQSTVPMSTGAHELGHSIGLDHCDAQFVDGDWTLMAVSDEPACTVGSHTADHFGSTSGGILHDCMLSSCFVAPSF